MITLLLLVKPVNLAILDVNRGRGFLEGSRGGPILKQGLQIMTFLYLALASSVQLFPCSPLPVGRGFKPTGRNTFPLRSLLPFPLPIR